MRIAVVRTAVLCLRQSHAVSFSSSPVAGFTLIEVLVTLLVVVLGFVGLLSMQSVSLQQTHQSYFATTANFLIRDLSDRMRGNRLGALAGDYVLPLSDAELLASADGGDCVQSPCEPAAMAAMDLHQWAAQASVLPGALIEVSALAAGEYQVFISWVGPRRLGQQAEGAAYCRQTAAQGLRSCQRVTVRI